MQVESRLLWVCAYANELLPNPEMVATLVALAAETKVAERNSDARVSPSGYWLNTLDDWIRKCRDVVPGEAPGRWFKVTCAGLTFRLELHAGGGLEERHYFQNQHEAAMERQRQPGQVIFKPIPVTGEWRVENGLLRLSIHAPNEPVRYESLFAARSDTPLWDGVEWQRPDDTPKHVVLVKM